MKPTIKRSAFTFLLSLILFFSMASNTFALQFDGNAGSGSGGSLTASGGYAVSSDCISNDNVRPVGYRFSVVNSNGTAQGSGPFDVYRSATDDDAITRYHFQVKLAKTELKAVYKNTTFITTSSTSRESLDSTLGLSLPEYTTGIESWSNIKSNINAVLKQINSSWSTDTLSSNGYSTLVEPIYELQLEGTWHSLTVTEIAVYGASKFGASVSPGSSNTSGSWNFIASYTNRYFPNSLKVETGHGLFDAYPATLTSNASFATIIDKGYGVAVLYGENIVKQYTISYNANGGTGAPAAQIKIHGVNLTMSKTIPTRTGYTFVCWNTKADGSGYDREPGGIVYGDSNLTWYAQWEVMTYTVSYDANGGSGAPLPQTKIHDINLVLSSQIPVRPGYTFVTWNSKADGSGYDREPGGTYYSNADYVWYAQWTPNTVGGYVDGLNGDDSNSGSTPSDPVATFKQAYTNLKDKGGIIYVVDTVPIDKKVTLTSTYYEDANGRVELAEDHYVFIMRYSKPTTVNNGFDVDSNVNKLIQVNASGELILENLVVDGHKNAVTEGSVNQIAEGVTAEAALITVEAGVLNIKDGSVLQNNHNPAGYGGGVYVMPDGTLNMTGGLIQNHHAEFGGGIANEGTLNLMRCTISSNVAYWKSGYMISGNGGGIYSTKSFTLPEGVLIQNNTAINGGGVYLDTDDDTTSENVAVLTFDGAEISGNMASDGAGVLVGHSNMIMKSGKITGNQAGDVLDRKSYGYGGGISVSGNRARDRGIVTVLGGEISHNKVVASYGAYGGGIYSHWATINMEAGIVTNNSCEGGDYSEGGGIFLNERSILNMTGGTLSKNSAEEGGGVALVYYYDSTANFSGDALVTENTATYCGGGIYNYGCGSEGGGIFVDGNARIDNNSAQWGGGIYCDYGYATVSGGTVESNTASHGGGVYLYNESVLTLTSNSIYSNSSDVGSGVYVTGAGEYNDISTFKMYDAACVGDTDRDGVSDTDEVYLEDGCYISVPSEFSNTSTDSSITTSKKALRAIVVPSTTELGRVIAKFGDESSTDGKKALYWNPESAKMTEQYFTVQGEVLRSGDQGAANIESIGVTARDVFISRSYDIVYDANGGTNAPATQVKYWNENLVLTTEKPTMAKFRFTSWNKNADGSGTRYSPGSLYADNSSVTLYAQWKIDEYGYKTIMVGDLVDPESYLDEFNFPEGKTIDTFDVIYNGVPRDAENRATTTGTGYTIVYDITFTDGSTGRYCLIVTVLDASMAKDELKGYIRFISLDHLSTLEPQSKWRFGDLKTRLEKTLAIQDPTDADALEVWTFEPQDVETIKSWVKSGSEAGKSREALNAEFTSQFSACRIK